MQRCEGSLVIPSRAECQQKVPGLPCMQPSITQSVNWKTRQTGNSGGNKNMPKKRNTCQEVPSVWIKTSSTLLSRPSPHLQPNFIGLDGVPLFPGQGGSLPAIRQRKSTYSLLWLTPYTCFLAKPVAECERHYGLVV